MRDRSLWSRVGPVIAFVLLGSASTVLVSGLSALREPPPTRGTVAKDGDHLQPWLLRTESLFADRTVFFEKGRVYSVRGAGPPGASSAAVSSWSFATSTRRNAEFVPGELTVPPDLQVMLDRKLPSGLTAYWGVCRERRGFPFRAFEGDILAPNASDAPSVWEARGSAVADTVAQQTSASLISLRMVPLRPVWAGLAADIAVWALGWLVVWKVIAGATRGLRRRKGHCPKCRYDLRGGPSRCPECGWVVSESVLAEVKPLAPVGGGGDFGERKESSAGSKAVDESGA